MNHMSHMNYMNHMIPHKDIPGGSHARALVALGESYEQVRKPPDKEVLYCERPLRRVDAIMFWHYMNNVPDRTRPDRKPDQTGSRTGPEAGLDRKPDWTGSWTGLDQTRPELGLDQKPEAGSRKPVQYTVQYTVQ